MHTYTQKNTTCKQCVTICASLALMSHIVKLMLVPNHCEVIHFCVIVIKDHAVEIIFTFCTFGV